MRKILTLFSGTLLTAFLICQGAPATVRPLTNTDATIGQTRRENQKMNIKITAQNHVFFGALNNSPTSQNLYEKLPLTLTLSRHQNREYYTDLSLDTRGNQTNGYQIGDIAYWVPGHNLVFFYDTGYTGNLIILGKITDGLDELSTMDAHFQAVIEKN